MQDRLSVTTLLSSALRVVARVFLVLAIFVTVYQGSLWLGEQAETIHVDRILRVMLSSNAVFMLWLADPVSWVGFHSIKTELARQLLLRLGGFEMQDRLSVTTLLSSALRVVARVFLVLAIFVTVYQGSLWLGEQAETIHVDRILRVMLSSNAVFMLWLADPVSWVGFHYLATVTPLCLALFVLAWCFEKCAQWS